MIGVSQVSEAEAGTQPRTGRALLAIRELILEGGLAPGDRVSELSVAEAFLLILGKVIKHRRWCHVHVCLGK